MAISQKQINECWSANSYKESTEQNERRREWYENENRIDSERIIERRTLQEIILQPIGLVSKKLVQKQACSLYNDDGGCIKLKSTLLATMNCHKGELENRDIHNRLLNFCCRNFLTAEY